MPDLSFKNGDIVINGVLTWNGAFMVAFIAAFIVYVICLTYRENMDAVYAESKQRKWKNFNM